MTTRRYRCLVCRNAVTIRTTGNQTLWVYCSNVHRQVLMVEESVADEEAG